jgi:hypothetical protein
VAARCIAPSSVEDVLRQDPFEFAPEQLHGPVLLRGTRSLGREHQRFGLRLGALARRDETLFLHLPQHEVALGEGSIGVAEGREPVRTADQAGQQGGLRER